VVPTTAARARLDIESQLPSVCSTGRSIATVRRAALVCRCVAIEVGGAATVDAVMPGEFPDTRVIPPVARSSKRKRHPRVGVSDHVLAE